MSLQTLKNKAFRVSVQWNALVRKPLSLERGGFTSTTRPFMIAFILKAIMKNAPLKKTPPYFIKPKIFIM